MHKLVIAIVILTIALLMAAVVTAQPTGPGTGPNDWPPEVLTNQAAQQTVTVLVCEGTPGLPWCVELTSVAASCAENFAPYCFELTPQATPTQERAVSPFNAISAPAPMSTPTLAIAVTYEPVRPLHSEAGPLARIVAFIAHIVEDHHHYAN